MINLTKEQQKIVDSENNLIVVKGVAGSGKSLTALHRAHKFASNYNQDKVLFLTFTNSLVNNLEDKYYELFKNDGVANITFQSINKFMSDLVFSKKTFEEYRNSKKYPRPKLNLDGVDEDYCDYLITSKIYNNEFGLDLNFMRSEIEFIRNNYITTKDEYLSCIRVGRKKQLRKNPRSFVYDVLQYVRLQLFNNVTTSYGRKQHKMQWEDIYRNYYENELDKNISKITEKYRYIIVDEVQDLSKLYLLFFLQMKNQLKDKISMSFFYDDAQSLYNSRYLGTGGNFKKLGFVNYDYFNLPSAYRSTRPIFLAAYNMLEHFSNNVLDNSVRKKMIKSDDGFRPFLITTDNDDEQYHKACKNIQKILETNRPKEIIVIYSKYYKKFLEIAKQYNLPRFEKLDKRHTDFDDDTIKISNALNIKGIEAKNVILLDANEIITNAESYEDSQIAQFYHVIFTRAMNSLLIHSTGEPNKFIGSIDKDYIQEIKDDKVIDLTQEYKMIKDFTVENQIKRFEKEEEKVQEEIKEAVKEERENEKIEEEIKKEEIKIPTFQDLKQEEMEKLKQAFPNFPDDIIQNLASGVLYFNNFEDYKSAIFNFSHVLETVFKQALNPKPETKITFGNIIHDLKYKESKLRYKRYCLELERLNILQIRNNNTHNNGFKVTKADVTVFYKYIITDKKLYKVYNEILKEEIANKESQQSVEKICVVMTNQQVIDLPQISKNKKLYTSLLDDGNMAVSNAKLKNNTEYYLRGYWKNLDGKKIFVIKEIKKTA